jgi:hypothetical protein
MFVIVVGFMSFASAITGAVSHSTTIDQFSIVYIIITGINSDIKRRCCCCVFFF